jgi:hypothetical protein
MTLDVLIKKKIQLSDACATDLRMNSLENLQDPEVNLRLHRNFAIAKYGK